MPKPHPKTPDTLQQEVVRGKRAKVAAKSATPMPAPPTPKGKLGLLVELMRRPDGSRIDEMMSASGWQAHSVRGAIAGALKKKLGLVISSEKGDQGRVYRILSAGNAS